MKLMQGFVAGLVLALGFFAPAYCAEPVSASTIGNTAIGGKDTVSYHAPDARKTHGVRQGDKKYEVEFLGAKWHFASRDSADRFAAEPSAFVPSYNGHCANALSDGEGLIRTDGAVWEFFGGKLYLFYAERGRQRWLKGDWAAFRQQADAAWRTVLQK